MPGPADSSEKTVRLWRRIFLGLYLAFTLGACLLAFLSILAYQLGAHEPPVKRGRRIMASADNPKELRDCHKRLERLATELHKETFTLQIVLPIGEKFRTCCINTQVNIFARAIASLFY